MENKALELIVAQEKHKEMVRNWTRKISGGLSKCRLSVASEGKNHLSEAYKIISYDSYDDVDREATSEKQVMFLKSICEHCLVAYDAVNERKIARKKLGIVKAQITKLAMKKINN